MNTSTRAALDRLRDADPARGLTPARSVVDDALHASLDLDVGALAVPVRTASRRLPIALAAAAVVAVAGLGAVIVHSRQAGKTPTASDAVTRTALSPTSSQADPSQAAALQRVERALAAVPALPGAERVATAPTRALERPSSSPMSDHLIDRSAFWTAPGTIDEALAYFKAHPPIGMQVTGYGSSVSTGTQATEQTVMFSGGSGPEVQVAVVGFAAGVAVRADAMEIWTPTKAPSEYLGAVDSVDVTVERPNSGPGLGAPTVHRTLTGPAAQRLAGVVDALPLDPGGVRSCPMDWGAVDTLVFHAGQRTVRMAAAVSGCALVRVTINGTSQPALAGSVDKQVLAELGLPSSYGY